MPEPRSMSWSAQAR